MRNIKTFDRGWSFFKDIDYLPTKNSKCDEKVNLPHTWNAKDGQDGGNDYFRGKCAYMKQFDKGEVLTDDLCYLEINGANLYSEVFLNGEKIAAHLGGYSKWRVNMTPYIRDENTLVITVDNSEMLHAYPSFADFTFYGGLYRSVNIISVPSAHFELDYYGTPGIKITPLISGGECNVEIETFVCNVPREYVLQYAIYDKLGRLVAKKNLPSTERKVTFHIEKPHLWQGRKDPYLYTAEVSILSPQCAVDTVSEKFGIREFLVDAERGFFLNGESYPLRGVSRHQDRKGFGNAILREHHREDMELIKEVGANTVRLAHYQHDDYFYRLCDEAGMVVWAEIPYISMHKQEAVDNTVRQMKELVIQNYNHPSICFWGLSNEITISGSENEDIIENHKILNTLVRDLDRTRLTTVACVSTCDINSEYIKIPDLVAYNHYFGWYGGDVGMNGEWLDNFHKVHPTIPIGISEYGCEALDYHTSTPDQGDYTEEYQAYYHEEMIKQLYTRPYIWASYVWNMFDFGADAREEGGEPGQNHKGLVTFDRHYKKDAFYAYKAWLSDEPFIHICSKRYEERVERRTKIKVYSNLPSVELFVDGQSVCTATSDDHFFNFEIENKGEQAIAVIGGECKDECRIKKVDEFNDKYMMKESGTVLNWFDVTMPDGKLSINEKIEKIMQSEKGKILFFELIGAKMTSDSNVGVKLNDDMLKMMGSFSFLRFANMAKMVGIEFSKQELLDFNKKLNKIDMISEA